MPYKKRTRRPAKRGAKGANNKQVTVWSDHNVLEKANRALALVNNVRRFINTEVKHHDVIVTAFRIPLTGNVNNLAVISQGDTSNNRDGLSLKPLNLTFRATLLHRTPQDDSRVRLIIFRGKQENGIAYTSQDLLETDNVLSPKNYSDRFRSKILCDKTFTMNQMFDASNRSYHFEKVIKMHGHVNYSEGSNAIEDGGIYIMVLSDQTLTADQPEISYYARLTFTDN